MKYELIIFDCDGVLVDSEAIVNRVIYQQARELGASLTFEEAEEKFSGGNLNMVIAYVEQEIGHPVPDDFVPVFRKRSFEAFETEIQAVAGVEQLIQQLTKPFCVGSNGPRNKIELTLGLTGLLPYFEGKIYSAYDVGKWKPDPTLYLTIAQTMNLEPHQCAVIEDSKFGVQAAKRAGMDVFGYAPHPKHEQKLLAEGATVFQHMSQLLPLLTS